MTPQEARTRQLYVELEPGDRVQCTHEVKVGLKRWQQTTTGTVVRKFRRRHSLHFRRAADDKVYSDCLVLSREDGELTTVTIDEFTVLDKLAEAPSETK